MACGPDDALYLNSCNSSDESMKWDFKEAVTELKTKSSTKGENN